MAYIYLWTHIPTQRWYLGSRTAFGCHTEDGYICSSDLVKDDIIQHRQEWARTILYESNERQDIIDMEYTLLETLKAIHNGRSLNQTNGEGQINYKPPVRNINTEKLKHILEKINYEQPT